MRRYTDNLSLGGDLGGNANSSGRALGRGIEGAGDERGGVGAKDFRAYQPGDTNPQWHAQRHRRYGPAAGSFLWDKPAILVEPADPLRCANRRTESGKSDSQPSKAETQRACARLNERALTLALPRNTAYLQAQQPL